MFCRIALPGASRLGELGADVRRIEIVIELDAPLPKGIVIDTTTICLHAAPAVSLHAKDARVEPAGSDGSFVLRTAAPDDRVVDVTSVELVEPGSQRPLGRWTPNSVLRDLDEQGGPILFEVRRRPSVIEGEVDLALSLLDEEGPVTLPAGTHLRARVLTTSAKSAAELAIGDVSQATERSPVGMTFRNVTNVTRGRPALFDGDRSWELLHLIKLGLRALTDRASLGRLLSLSTGEPAFDGLRGVTRNRSTVVANDEVCPGIELSLDLDAASFEGPGHVRLFGEIVSELLASALRPYEWATLTVVTDGESFSHPRRFGTRGTP